MVLIINPADAQSIQEDEAQLLYAIGHATRSTVGLLSRVNSSESPQLPEGLRIQMGRRLVYGQMSRGQFRNELDGDRMKALFDALQRPAAEGIDPSQYHNKIPAIEIRDGEQVLFREERDGTITVNEIQFQLERGQLGADIHQPQHHQVNQAAEANQTPQPTITQPSITSPNPKETVVNNLNGHRAAVQNQQHSLSEETDNQPSPAPHPAIQDSDWKADDMAQVAEYLLNPLGQGQPIYDEVAIQGYRIQHTEEGISVNKEGHSILTTQAGKVTTSQITEQDWEIFQRI